MKHSSISAIIKGKWAIDPLYAVNALQMVQDMLTGKMNVQAYYDDGPSEHRSEIEKAEDLMKQRMLVAKPNASTGIVNYYRWEDAPEGSVAIIRVYGALMKADGDCGEPGMATIGDRIKRANKMRNIAAIVLDVDSPGGTVDGTIDLANIVKSSEKPIVGFVNGQACSAAAWIITGTKEIYGNDDFAEIGSIGVLMTMFDLIPYWEKQGAKYHQIVSSLSPEKVKMFDDIRNGKYEGYTNEVLDPICLEFRRVIKENRPKVTDNHITGRVFFAKDVLGVYIDKIGTIEQAIERAAELAQSSPNTSNVDINANSTKNHNTMHLENLNAILDTELQSQDGHIALNEEQVAIVDAAIGERNTLTESLQAANAERDTANARIAELEQTATERDTANASLETANASLETANARIAELEQAATERDTANASLETANARIAELEQLVPGASPANHGGKKEVVEAPTSEDEMEKLDKMSITERMEYLKTQESK